MNSIGFKNFRKFTEFPSIDLGEITILVGGNNAGKSTLVKAMLLMRDFLKSRIEGVGNSFVPRFNFDAEHVNIGDFYRAFCRQSSKEEDTISFSMGIEQFLFSVDVRGARKPGIVPEITLITVADKNRDIYFIFDFLQSKMTIRFVLDEKALNSNLERREIEIKINDLNKLLSASKDLEQISNIKLQIEKLEKMAHSLDSAAHIFEHESMTIDMVQLADASIGKLVIPELINAFVAYSEHGTLGDKRSKEYKEKVSQKNYLKGKASIIKSIAEEVEEVINKQAIEYIYAHSVAQTPIYAHSITPGDYTNRVIHEFYNSRVSSGDEEFDMIEKWMHKDNFNIGNSLKVIPYKGDNYSIVIYDAENPEILDIKDERYPGGIDLCDKGIGSIQLVILLLRLATLARKYKGQQLTVLLEEPEQNLHPVLQSKLADLLQYVNENFGVRFITETHSEYMIRKSQVQVAEMSFADQSSLDASCPIAVYYFPTDGVPYKMIYRTDGKFKNGFGKGFYDEAANLAFDIM